ncbi:MAG: SAM-dependent methyltransferase [Magnetospirillum sp.]|nr:SAM-dependent methyltransferase [Magnetospirillum sp.]
MAQTPLGAELIETVRRDGPMPVSAFMAKALLDPSHGYYATRDPLGAAGDFVTAPEISQMFGELIGLWAAVVWQSMGMPARVVLAELGPGRGTLMADALRAARTLPPFHAAVEPWLVDASPALRECQRRTLAGAPVRWAGTFEDLPPGPLLLVANEFFDALPIDQFVKAGGQWHERLVGLDAKEALAFAQGSPAIPPLAPAVMDAADGAIAEICPQGRKLAAGIGRRLAAQGGAALIIDYGPVRSTTGDSLQAVRRHRFHGVFDDVGDADLTAHVDFEALAAAAVPARAWGPVTQGDFLRALGIETRAGNLARANPPDAAADILGRMHRLIGADEMGTLFKVMALAHPALPPPPGLATA